MKKIITLLMLIAMLTGCTKEQNSDEYWDDPEQKTYAVEVEEHLTESFANFVGEDLPIVIQSNHPSVVISLRRPS